MKHGLSKSRYTQFRTCSKALWLNLFKPQEGIINEDTLERFAFGVEVGNLAKGLLGAYEDMTVHREDGHLDYAAMVAKTKEALTRGVENICEAAFSHDGNYCAVDILHKTEGDYAIYEVKSSTHDDKKSGHTLSASTMNMSARRSSTSSSFSISRISLMLSKKNTIG